MLCINKRLYGSDRLHGGYWAYGSGGTYGPERSNRCHRGDRPYGLRRHGRNNSN